MSEHPTSPSNARRIEGRREWLAALRAALAHAVDHEREVVLVDAHFEGWPLDDAEVLQHLLAFSKKPLRRVLMVAARFDAVPVHCPLFTRWRRDFGHVISCHQTDVEASQVPSLLLAGPHSVHLSVPTLWRGHWLHNDKDRRDWRDVVDVLLQRSEPGFAPTTLGL
jgi:hypothetical protein